MFNWSNSKKSRFTHELTASRPCSTPLSWISRAPTPPHGCWSRRQVSRATSSGLPLEKSFSPSVRSFAEGARFASAQFIRYIYIYISYRMGVENRENSSRNISPAFARSSAFIRAEFQSVLLYLSRIFFRKYFSRPFLSILSTETVKLYSFISSMILDRKFLRFD